MPGLTPALNDVLQLRVESRMGNQISLNVIHYRVTLLAASPQTLQQLVTSIATRMQSAYAGWMPATATIDAFTLQNVTPPVSVAATQSVVLPGTGGANGVPRQVSGLISSTTNFAGRNQRGRVYVGFPSAAWIDTNGELTGAGLAKLVSVRDILGPAINLINGANVTSIEMVIRHPNNPGPPETTNVTTVVGLLASTGLATQRRRGDFGRINV